MTKARDLADLGGVTTRLDELGNSDGALSNRNLIINGAMQVAQRGTSFTSTSGYTLDRWKVETGASGAVAVTQEAFTLGQTDVPDEPKNYMRVTLTGLPTDPKIIQHVEGVRTLAGQTCTLSFWAKADSAKTISEGGFFTQNFGSGGSSNVNTNIGAWSVTTSWQKITITTTLPSISGKTIGGGDKLEVRLDPNGGENVVLDIANVQLEVGDTATPFEHRSYGQELALCQRYYQAFGAGAVGAEENTTQADFGITLNTPMRTNPSTSLRQSNIFIRLPSIAADRTMTSTINGATAIGPRGGWLYLDISGGVAGRVIIERSGLTIGFADAEL